MVFISECTSNFYFYYNFFSDIELSNVYTFYTLYHKISKLKNKMADNFTNAKKNSFLFFAIFDFGVFVLFLSVLSH